jgi:hypothetical protein
MKYFVLTGLFAIAATAAFAQDNAAFEIEICKTQAPEPLTLSTALVCEHEADFEAKLGIDDADGLVTVFELKDLSDFGYKPVAVYPGENGHTRVLLTSE